MSSSGAAVPHHPQLIPMHEWQRVQHSSATKDSQRQSIRTPWRSLAQAPEDPEIQISRREGVGVGRGCSSSKQHAPSTFLDVQANTISSSIAPTTTILGPGPGPGACQ